MLVYAKNIGGVWFGVTCDEQHVFAASFGPEKEKVLLNLQEILPTNQPLKPDSVPSRFAENTFSAMKRLYDGKDASETIPLSMERLPAYTQRVLRTVSQIPIGYVASYGGVAEAAGGGARAVGNAMANNPFAPLVPCHRVVTSSLGLGGYGGGLRVKYEFLKREKRGFAEPQTVAVEDGVLQVFPVEFVLRKLARSAVWNRP